MLPSNMSALRALTHIAFHKTTPTNASSNHVNVLYAQAEDENMFPGWGWLNIYITFNGDARDLINNDVLTQDHKPSTVYSGILDVVTTDDKSALKYSVFALTMTSRKELSEDLRESLQEGKWPNHQDLEEDVINMWIETAIKLHQNFCQRIIKAKLLTSTNQTDFRYTSSQYYDQKAKKGVVFSTDHGAFTTFQNHPVDRSALKYELVQGKIDFPKMAQLVGDANTSLQHTNRILSQSRARQCFSAAITYVQQCLAALIMDAGLQAVDGMHPELSRMQKLQEVQEEELSATTKALKALHKPELFSVECFETAKLYRRLVHAGEFAALLAQTLVQDRLHENAQRHFPNNNITTIPNKVNAELNSNNEWLRGQLEGSKERNNNQQRIIENLENKLLVALSS